jgi:hypothetical protein
MTANDLADLVINADTLEVEEYFSEIATMLRQQQSEIEVLKKELALQRLSDIGQTIERELTNDEIMEICDEVGRDLTRWGYFQIEFAKAILRKASEK